MTIYRTSVLVNVENLFYRKLSEPFYAHAIPKFVFTSGDLTAFPNPMYTVCVRTTLL